jgi:iron complex outermembrane recepter protein
MRTELYGAMALLVGVPGVAHAQDEAQQTDTESYPATSELIDPEAIIVTASRSGTPIEQLPISVTVIDEDELASQLHFNTNILRAIESAAPRP